MHRNVPELRSGTVEILETYRKAFRVNEILQQRPEIFQSSSAVRFAHPQIIKNFTSVLSRTSLPIISHVISGKFLIKARRISAPRVTTDPGNSREEKRAAFPRKTRK